MAPATDCVEFKVCYSHWALQKCVTGTEPVTTGSSPDIRALPEVTLQMPVRK